MKDEQNSMDDGMKKLLRRAEEGADTPTQNQNATDQKENKPDAVKKPTKKLKDNEVRNAFRKLTGWDDSESVNVSLRTIVGGDFLAGRWFRKHFLYLFFLAFLAIWYVTNRYAYQQEMIDNRKLTLLLEDRRLRAVVATSNLTEYTRRSNISTQLSDTTLKSSPEPFYYLQTDK